MLAIDYYHKIKDLYHKDVIKSKFIYLYTIDSVVDKVGFTYRKHGYKLVNEVPHDKLLLSRDKKLPREVLVQIKFNPLEILLIEM